MSRTRDQHSVLLKCEVVLCLSTLFFTHACCRWEKEFHELQSKYLPYQTQIDQLVGRIKGLQNQSDLAESEVHVS